MRRTVFLLILVMSFSIITLGKEVTITVLATTDIHGNITGMDYAADKQMGYGLARAATLIDSLRSNKKNVILVDCGDTLTGNPLAYYQHNYADTEPDPVITAMNTLKYDVAVPGNHDFDFGAPFLVDTASKARFPWISANIVQQDNSSLFSGTQIIERSGVKVGFFGLTTPATGSLQPPVNVEGVKFTDMVDAAQKAVAELKQQGANVIVALVHSGKGEKLQQGKDKENAVYQIVENVPGIDVIVFGHSHMETPLELYQGVLLCQPKDHAESIGVIMIDLQQRDGNWEILSKSSTTLKVASSQPDRKIEREMKTLAKETERFMGEDVGEYRTELTLTENPLSPGPGVLLKANGMQSWKPADIQVVSISSPGKEIKSRRATLANNHIFQLVPYDDHLIQVKVSGEQLKQMMEHAASLLNVDGTLKTGVPFFKYNFFIGATANIDPKQPVGSRVQILKVNGKPYTPQATYTIDMVCYLYGEEAGDYFGANRPEAIEYSKKSFRYILTEYVKNLQPSKDE